MKVILTGLLVLWGATAHAESGFVLGWDVVTPCGGSAAAAGTALQFAIGETAVGTAASAGWSEDAGFWAILRPGSLVDVPDDAPDVPIRYALYPGAPNPSSGRTAIRYTIPPSAANGVRIGLRVFDVSGRLVRILVDEPRSPGEHVAAWDGNTRSGAPARAGVYLCRMQAGSFVATRRLVVIR